MVGRGLAPAARCPNSEYFAPALPWKFNFVRRGRSPRRPATNYIFLAVYARNAFYRVGNGLDRSTNLPTCWGGGTRKARDGGASHIKIHGRAWKPAPTTGRRVVAPYARISVCPFRYPLQTPICHPERSEGSPTAQNINIRHNTLRRTAQNENAGCFACYAKTECAHRKYTWRFGENIAISIVDIVPRRRNESR